MAEAIERVSIIISRGSLEGVYPGLIMANGARAEGIEADLFFTFFGLEAVHKVHHEHLKLATVGNPGLHLATMLGGRADRLHVNHGRAAAAGRRRSSSARRRADQERGR